MLLQPLSIPAQSLFVRIQLMANSFMQSDSKRGFPKDKLNNQNSKTSIQKGIFWNIKIEVHLSLDKGVGFRRNQI